MVQEPLYVREVTQAIPEHLSITEAMRLTTLSRSTIDRLCAEGRLEKRRVSAGRAVITVESLERHLTELNGAESAPVVSEERVSRRQQALRAQSTARRKARQSRRQAA
jgi:predicted DNA-binding transcriptional regulator AlpA